MPLLELEVREKEELLKMAKLETNNYYCSRFNIIPQLPSIASVAYSASFIRGLLGRFSAKSGRCGKEMSFLFVLRVIAPPSIILDVCR